MYHGQPRKKNGDSPSGGCVFDLEARYDPDAYRLEHEIAAELP